MAASSRKQRLWTAALVGFASAAVALGGCAQGNGEGTITAQVTDPECGLDGELIDLRPTFFAADPAEDFIEIRIQRGSDFEDLSNGITIFVADAEEVHATSLGMPLDLADPTVARMNLFLGAKCAFERDRPATNFISASGELIFDALFVPGAQTGKEITGRFANVRVEDPSRSQERFAILNGDFSFIFNRGRPAQRFP